MPDVYIDMTQVVALSGELVAAAAAVDVKATRSVTVASQTVEQTAKQLAPYRTGALRRSIHTEGSGTEQEVVADVSYALYVEFGTSKMSPQPFMYPASNVGEQILETMSQNDVNPFGA